MAGSTDMIPGVVVPGLVPIRVEVEEGKDYYWCTCGRSKNQPFCDGSHKAEGCTHTPMKWTSDVTGPKWFCQCKHSTHPPFCDGSHSKLSPSCVKSTEIEDLA